MPFPESQRVVFGNNPLDRVIVQLQFPPILAIAASEPAEFQSRVRSAYPLYSRQPLVVVPQELTGLVGAFSLTSQQLPTRHVFSTSDESRSASLSRDFLALEDTRYRRWESFRAEVTLLKDALEAVYQPAFYSRVGLRYIDIINPERLRVEHWDGWENHINPTLLGLLGHPSLKSEVVDSVSVATLGVPGVSGGLIRLQYGVRPTDSAAGASRSTAPYVIDVDLFTQSRTNTSDVVDTLDAFNRLAGNLFRWAITDKLRDALQPVALD